MSKIKKIVSSSLALITTCSLGMLSLGTMFFISASLPFSIVAFFLAVAIEGAVYNDNIHWGIKRFGNQKYYLKLAFATRKLNELKKSNAFKNNIFLQDYFNQKKYLHLLEKIHHDDVAKAELQRVKLRLERMELLFLGYIENPSTYSEDIIEEIIPLAATINKKIYNKEINDKNTVMNWSILLSAIAGTCAGLVSLASFQASFLTIGLLVSFTILAPFVSFVAIGYSLILYRTITDMIQNETLKGWYIDLKNFLKQKNKDYLFYLKLAGISIIILVAIAATIMMAGTWWYLAKMGAKLIPYFPTIAANIVIAITWVCSLIPNFLFNIVNAFKSAEKIPHIIIQFFQNLITDISTTWKNENIFQFINPFRIVNKIFKALIFIGHLISIAVTADRCPMVSPKISTGITLANETLNDLSYIVHDDASDEEEGHEHHHGDFLLSTIGALFNGCSIIWDWLTSGCNSWQKSKEKFIEHKNLPLAPELSEKWMKYETNLIFDQSIKKYNTIPEKLDAFTQLKKTMLLKSKELYSSETYHEKLKTEIAVVTQHGKPLITRRFFPCLKQSPPNSQKILMNIKEDKSFKL